MRRIYNILNFKNGITFVFLFFISLNFLLFFVIKQEPTDEYSNKIKAPLPTYDSTGIEGLMIGFDKHFNDYLPFKYNYISLSNFCKVKFKAFNSSHNVIIGNDDWLFYNACVFDSTGLNEYSGFNAWNAEQLNKVAKNINAIKNWCQKNNIKFELVLCPNKQSIYSEYLPSCYTKIGDNRYDQLMKRVPDLINLKAIFLKHKNQSKKYLYYKTDTHWNLFGAYLASKELYNKWKPFYPELNDISKVSFKDSIIPNGLDLANMLVLNNFYKDSYTDVKFETQNNAKKIPQLLIVHDSFLSSMLPSLNELFSTITTRHLYSDGIPSPEYLLKHKPDVFIIEYVERYKECLVWDIHPDFFK